MDDLISRREAIDALTENKEMINAVLDSLALDYNTRRNEEQRRGQINEDIETIKALPSAQPKRKKGKWERIGHTRHRCSECKGVALLDDFGGECLTDFCSCCGAEMEPSIGTFSEK